MSHNGNRLPRVLPFGAFITRMEQITRNKASGGDNVLRTWVSTGEHIDVHFKNGGGYDALSATVDNNAGVAAVDAQTSHEADADGNQITRLNLAFKNLCGTIVKLGETTTIPSGGNAEVTATGDDRERTLHFALPRGEKGPTGATGAAGLGIHAFSGSGYTGYKIGDWLVVVHFTNGVNATHRQVYDGIMHAVNYPNTETYFRCCSTYFGQTFIVCNTTYQGVGRVAFRWGDGWPTYWKNATDTSKATANVDTVIFLSGAPWTG